MGNDHAWEMGSRSANREERDQGYVVYTRKRTREIYSFIGALIGYSLWSIFFFFFSLMMIFFSIVVERFLRIIILLKLERKEED